MNTSERISKECKAIINAITSIQLGDYNNLGYYLTKWELTIESNAVNFKPIEYSRVHLFNTVLSPTVNKLVFLHFGIFNAEQFKDETKSPNITGYICLKYPYSEIPQ